MKGIIYLFLSTFIFISCSLESERTDVDKKDFNFFLSEPCMIVNHEQDNTIEGEYIKVETSSINDSVIKIKFPINFYLNNSNYNNWVIGWGNNKPYYDAGVENIRSIIKVNKENSTLHLGSILRGEGLPIKDQRVVFWNKKPSGYYNYNTKPIIDPTIWDEFSGESVSLGAVEYDSLLGKWCMIVNEFDTDTIQTYAALSDNLIDWQAANNGKPILTASDFENCKWAGVNKNGDTPQTTITSDIVRYNNKWYLFMDGYSSDGKRHIGYAVSENSLLGPYTFSEEPVLSPGADGSWNERSVFYAKVKRYKDGFIMFYDGCTHDGYEQIGKAFSKDLTSWEDYNDNPVIDEHTGWRSYTGASEPNYIEVKNDSIFLMIAGIKQFNLGFWSRYITKRMFVDKSGNVDDTQLGLYLSTDGGESFVEDVNNPIFTNDYTNYYENEHMGVGFRYIETDTMDFIICQAKSSYEGARYNVILKAKDKAIAIDTTNKAN